MPTQTPSTETATATATRASPPPEPSTHPPTHADSSHSDNTANDATNNCKSFYLFHRCRGERTLIQPPYRIILKQMFENVLWSRHFLAIIDILLFQTLNRRHFLPLIDDDDRFITSDSGIDLPSTISRFEITFAVMEYKHCRFIHSVTDCSSILAVSLLSLLRVKSS